jgi:hypothetical protein
MKFDAGGRVIISVEVPPVAFNGGTPITESGAISFASADPQVFLGSLGYVNAGAICARAVLPASDGQGGFGRDAAGGLAIATSEPIVGYIAGIPIVADGRIAVSIEGPPPPNTSGFTNGFDATAFH